MSDRRQTTESRRAEAERRLEATTRELLTLEREHGRYKETLRRIADAESGHWGMLAREALHPRDDDEAVA